MEFFFNKAYIVTILKALLKPSDIFTLLQPTDGVVRKLSKISIAINLYQAHGAFHLVNLSTKKEFFLENLLMDLTIWVLEKATFTLLQIILNKNRNITSYNLSATYSKVSIIRPGAPPAWRKT